MTNIKPLHALNRSEIRELAHAAAERGEAMADANPYLADSAAALRWEADYADCVLELEAELA